MEKISKLDTKGAYYKKLINSHEEMVQVILPENNIKTISHGKAVVKNP